MNQVTASPVPYPQQTQRTLTQMQQHIDRILGRMQRFKSSHQFAKALALGLFCTFPLHAEYRDTPLESLTPSVEHVQAAATVAHIMQRYHYSRVKVDDALSERIFDRYLTSLDPQKMFLQASDIKAIEKYRLEFDDALQEADLDPVFDIFKRFRGRVEERATHAKQLLSRDFDFTVDESYTFNREDAPWAESQQAADELWRKRVKNDVLNLRLADRSKEELTQTLEDRYQRMQRRVSQLSANEVFQLFVNAYTLSVEPHTSYFSPRSSENFQINMSLSLEGIGAELRTENEYTVIQRLITGGPAAMSEELSAESRIIGVGQGEDGDIVDVVSWPLSDVVDLIRGPKGSMLRLKVLPGNAPEGSPPSIVTLVRDKIKLEEQAAKSSIMDVQSNDETLRYGVINLPTFYMDSAARAQGQPDYRSTTRDVHNLLKELTSGEDPVDGVIMDLRGNGGGSLVEATELTGLFVKTGPIVQIRSSDGRVETEKDNDPLVAYDGPLAVLVDRNSASASEIFAAAIQDYGRGVVIGEPTFGKGTVQTIAPLDEEGKLGQLKITVAQFFRVNGEGTQFRGVVPDVLLPTALNSDAQGERGLDNALPWAEVAAASFDPWSAETVDYAQAQTLHEARYRANDSFDLLTQELEAQRTARAQNVISLVESVRQEEISEQETDRTQRLELLRRAFGASGNDDESEDAVADIILEEAANVLRDVMDDVAASEL